MVGLELADAISLVFLWGFQLCNNVSKGNMLGTDLRKEKSDIVKQQYFKLRYNAKDRWNVLKDRTVITWEHKKLLSIMQ